MAAAALTKQLHTIAYLCRSIQPKHFITNKLRNALQIILAEGLEGDAAVVFRRRFIPMCEQELQGPLVGGSGPSIPHRENERFISAILGTCAALREPSSSDTSFVVRPLRGLSILTGTSWSMPIVQNHPVRVAHCPLPDECSQAQDYLPHVTTILRLENAAFAFSPQDRSLFITSHWPKILEPYFPKEIAALAVSYLTPFPLPSKVYLDATPTVCPLWLSYGLSSTPFAPMTLLDAQAARRALEPVKNPRQIAYNRFGCVAYSSNTLFIVHKDGKVRGFAAHPMRSPHHQGYAVSVGLEYCTFLLPNTDDLPPLINEEPAAFFDADCARTS